MKCGAYESDSDYDARPRCLRKVQVEDNWRRMSTNDKVMIKSKGGLDDGGRRRSIKCGIAG